MTRTGGLILLAGLLFPRSCHPGSPGSGRPVAPAAGLSHGRYPGRGGQGPGLRSPR
ncbi:MAG: hypothetical protein MZV70_18365 [Desulfobacterales bacterium]|nr:hypothetical protein [Desulfobacterales bacterium]